MKRIGGPFSAFHKGEDGQFVVLHGLSKRVTVCRSVELFTFVMGFDGVHGGRPALPWDVLINH